MAEEPDFTAMDRWLAGDASAEDAATVRAWIASDPANAALLQTLGAGEHGAEAHWNVDAAWAKVSARAMGAPDIRPLPGLVRGSRSVVRFAQVAAVLVVVAATAVLWRTRGHAGPAPAPAVTMLGATEVSTPNGSKRTVTLGDGTKVWLNAGSRMRHFAQATGARDVALEGEAYFEVVHDQTRPFRVHVRGNLVEDIGTRFVISAYADEPHVQVAVAEGTVSVRHESESRAGTAVTRGQMATLPSEGAIVVAPNANEERFFGWTKGALVLDGIALRDALPILERWFGATIDVNEKDASLAARKVNATFHGETLDEVVAAIALALDANYRVSGHSVTFTGRSR